MYADDLAVFAPSAKGLQKVLNICDVFSKNNDIIYNCNQSKLMIFDTNKYGNCVNINIGSNILSDVKSYKNLYFCSNSANCKLFSNIAAMYIYVCLCFFKNASWKSITFNNAFRIILKLNRRCSASAMFQFVNNNVNSFMEIHRKMVFSFLRRIQQSHNFLVSCILRSDCLISSQLLQTWHRALNNRTSSGFILQSYLNLLHVFTSVIILIYILLLSCISKIMDISLSEIKKLI